VRACALRLRLTVAEHFRDYEGADTLLFIDQHLPLHAGGLRGLHAARRMPSAVGYQPILPRDGELQERITSTRRARSHPCRRSMFPPTTSPIQHRRRHSSPGATPCSRGHCRSWYLPAVDPLASTSRILSPRIVGQEHYDVAQGVKKILQRYKDCRTSSRSSASTNSPRRQDYCRAARKVSASYPSPSTLLRSSPAFPARTSSRGDGAQLQGDHRRQHDAIPAGVLSEGQHRGRAGAQRR